MPVFGANNKNGLRETMKKVFLLSTAMVMASTAAFAEMKVSGGAEAGFIHDGTAVGDKGSFDTKLEMKFTGEAMTDDGVSIGVEAKFDTDEADEMTTKFWTKGAFGEVHLGDVDGAMASTMADIFSRSSIRDVAESSIGDVAEDHDGAWDASAWDEAGSKPAARYDYTRDAFEFSASWKDGDAGVDAGYAFAGAYSFDAGMADLRVAAAIKTTPTALGDDEAKGASVEADLKNGVKAAVSYTAMTVGGVDDSHTGIKVGYEMDKMEFGANYGKSDAADGYGFTANYDLGGGVKAKAGYGTYGDEAKMSLGLGMKF